MYKIKEIINNFEENLKSIDQLGMIGSDSAEILLDMLNSLKQEHENLQGFAPYKGRLNSTIGQVEKIKENPRLKEKYSIIYNQSVVLVVASFESFMNDLVRDIIDYLPEIINWQETKKISFDPTILKYSSPSLGSVIVKSSLREKYNFQDIKSVLGFVKDYLDIDINLNCELKDKLIKYEAIRHIIIHNSSRVDEKFIKQIRDTSFSNKYKVKEDIKLSEFDYDEARRSYAEFTKLIGNKILEKSGELEIHES